jgi:hypothetical protein
MKLNYTNLYEEFRVVKVEFRMLYPGEQDTPLCSVEMGFLANYNIST